MFMYFLTLARNWCRSNVLSGKGVHPGLWLWFRSKSFSIDLWRENWCHVWGKWVIMWYWEICSKKARKLIKIKSHVKNLEVSLKGLPMHQSWGIRKNEQLIETYYISESLNPQWYSRKKKTKLTLLFGISMKQIIYFENHSVIKSKNIKYFFLHY